MKGIVTTRVVGVVLTLALVGSACAARTETRPYDSRPIALLLARDMDRRSPRNNAAAVTSVVDLLGVLELGAGGRTKAQIDHILQPGASVDGAVSDRISEAYRSLQSTLDLKNGVWLARGLSFHQDFQKSALALFDTDTTVADFPKDNASIERWVNDATGGKIAHIDIPSGTILIAIAASRYKGSWKYPFERLRTRAGPFYSRGAQRNVQFMSNTFSLPYWHDANSSFIALPLQRGCSMTIALPNNVRARPAVRDALIAVQGPAHVAGSNVSIVLPRFVVDARSDLEAPLQRAGGTALFDSGADFSPMFGRAGGPITQMYEQTHVSIDEVGVEAAGIAVANIAVGPSRAIVVNHPFAFVISRDADK